MEERKLVLLHTNDIHSHFERMPRIGGAIRRLRQAHGPDELIVLDCGDHMDRMRPETEGSEGLANIAVLNETGYDLVVPGNNEGLTFTLDRLRHAYEQRKGYSVVCANLYDRSTSAPPDWMEPYRIFDKGGLRVGMIGLTAYFPDFYRLLGWDVLEPFETASRLVRELRERVDVLVVVSHLGLTRDKTMAETIPGIDIILGSHTHHLLEEPLLLDGTYIAAAGCYGRHVGVLEFRYRTDDGSLRLHAGRCLSTDDFPASPEIDDLIRSAEQTSRLRLEQPVASLDYPLGVRWDAESELGNLLASGLRRRASADIGVVNAGQVLEGLEAGPVTKYRLLEICPHPINPCLVRISGEQLWQALEEALLGEYTGKAIKGFGFRGKVLGTLCLSGADVEYEAGGEPYRKIRSVTIGGAALERDRFYTVGTIDMFTFGIGYLSLGSGETVDYYLPEFIRDVLENQLRDPEEIRKCSAPHWFAV